MSTNNRRRARLAKKNTGKAEILIYDMIGEDPWYGGVSPKSISEKLNEFADEAEITVRINSPGGYAHDGIAIYNLLAQAKPKIIVQVDGWACSAASVIAMAGDEVVMAEGSMMMIHNAWGLAVGDKHDMELSGAYLGKLDEQIIGIYARRSGQAAANIRAMMDRETWMDGSEAVDGGFADRVNGDDQADEPKNAASVLARYKNVPEALQRGGVRPRAEFQRWKNIIPQGASAMAKPTEITTASGTAAASSAKDGAAAEIRANAAETLKSSDDLAAREKALAEREAALAAREARQKADEKIRDLCRSVGMEKQGEAWIDAKLSVEDARDKIIAEMAKEHRLSAAGRDQAEKPDAAAAAKKEFAEHEHVLAAMGVSAEDYALSMSADPFAGMKPVPLKAK